MKVRPIALAAGALAAAMSFASVSASAKDTLKFLYPWSKVQEANWKIVQAVAEDIKKLSGGEMDVKIFNRTVVPPFKQLQPISAGAFDLHYTSTGYHSGVTSIGQLGDTLKKDPKLRRGSGAFDLVDKHYQRTQNIKVLGWAGTPGFQILLKEPIGPDGGLKGRKIRGNPAYLPLITALGGTMVTLTAPQIYTSLQKNLIDGTAWVQHSQMQRKFYEVVKYMARPTFGTSTQVLVMNLTRFNKLSKKMKDVMIQAGKDFEVSADSIVSSYVGDDLKGMESKGVKITKYGPKYYDHIQQIYNEGVWKRIIKKHGAEAEAIIKLAKAKGLVLK